MVRDTQERRGLLATIRGFFGGAATSDEDRSLDRPEQLAPPAPPPVRPPERTTPPPLAPRMIIDLPTPQRAMMPPPTMAVSSYQQAAQTPHRPVPPPSAPPPTNSKPARDARPTTHDSSPAYRQRADFLTPAEAAFFAVLREATGAGWHINAKVRLADLVDAPAGREWQAAWNKISRKHVDFVLCDPATMRPRVVIELDDRSHRRPDRIERDAFVDRVFADATLPILHIPVRRGYDPATLRLQILGALGTPAPAPAARQPQEERHCERCGAAMQQRTARRGDHAGSTFWGCTNYPRCRHIVPIAA